MELRNTLARSMLLYNWSTWRLSVVEEETLASLHIKQLRKIIGVQYRTKMRNKQTMK